MAGFAALFGQGSTARQLFEWQVIGALVSAAIQPLATDVSSAVNAAHPVLPLTPAEAAAAANRNYLPRGEAASEASKAGVSGHRFDVLAALAGDAPGPQQLTEALRRGIIPEQGAGADAVSFEQGIKETNLHDKWTTMMRRLAVQPPSVADALEALLQGQTDEATARRLYEEAGGDPRWFTLLFDSRGAAPSPVELGVMANRGIIPWDGQGPNVVSFLQGFLEGPFRNKWEGPMRGLAEYRPPPRTVTALLRNGTITPARALVLFRQAGLSAELAAAYVADAGHAKTTAGKELTQAQIVTLFEAHTITQAEASTLLTKIGYSAEEARLILSGAGLRRVISQLNSAVTKVRGNFLAGHITAGEAKNALRDLGIAGDAQAQIIHIWQIEDQADVKALTASQIEQAFAYGIMSQAAAQAALERAGYRPHDAWVLLSIRHRAPLPNEPAG